jgi:hypothetical protein
MLKLFTLAFLVIVGIFCFAQKPSDVFAVLEGFTAEGKLVHFEKIIE